MTSKNRKLELLKMRVCACAVGILLSACGIRVFCYFALCVICYFCAKYVFVFNRHLKTNIDHTFSNLLIRYVSNAGFSNNHKALVIPIYEQTFEPRHAKKSAFECTLNARTHIILHMRKVSAGHLLSIETLYVIQ